MIVRTAGNDGKATVYQGLCQRSGVFLHLFGIFFPFRLQNFAEGNGFCSDDMLQRTALNAGEYGRVEQLGHHLDFALRCFLAPGVGEVLAHHDDTATRTAECLMGGRGHDMGIFHGIIQFACGNQSGRVCHVYHQDSTYLVGYFAHAFVVPFA